MNPSVAKVRRLLLRALAKADVEDDVKTALEISKMLLPLEQSIEDKKAAAETVTAKGTSDLSALTIDQLLERTEMMRERLLELRDVPPKSVDAPPETSPIVVMPDSAPLESTRSKIQRLNVDQRLAMTGELQTGGEGPPPCRRR